MNISILVASPFQLTFGPTHLTPHVRRTRRRDAFRTDQARTQPPHTSSRSAASSRTPPLPSLLFPLFAFPLSSSPPPRPPPLPVPARVSADGDEDREGRSRRRFVLVSTLPFPRRGIWSSDTELFEFAGFRAAGCLRGWGFPVLVFLGARMVPRGRVWSVGRGARLCLRLHRIYLGFRTSVRWFRLGLWVWFLAAVCCWNGGALLIIGLFAPRIAALIDRAGIGKRFGYEFAGKVISSLVGRFAGPTDACFVFSEASVFTPLSVLLCWSTFGHILWFHWLTCLRNCVRNGIEARWQNS